MNVGTPFVTDTQTLEGVEATHNVFHRPAHHAQAAALRAPWPRQKRNNTASSTPPDILARFGFDPSWTRLYLPEIRLFIAPNGARDLAIDGGARNLLIGLGQSAGVTGDFDLQVLNQGGGPLTLNTRFYDTSGHRYGLIRTSSTKASVQLPEFTVIVIDVEGGLTPYDIKATWKGVDHAGPRHNLDLIADALLDVVIHVVDTSGTKEADLTIHVSRRPVAALPAVGSQTQPQPPPIELRTTLVKRGNVHVGSPHLRLISETSTSATIGLDSGETATWTVASQSAASGTTVDVGVTPGQKI